jgi:hypothetical protein
MPNVIGIFTDSSQARQAIDRITNNSIGLDQIGMIAIDAEGGELKKEAGSFGTGAGIGTAGALQGTLADLGVPKDESTSYEEQLRGGNVLVTVRTADDTEADRVANLMEVEGAVDIEGAGERGNVEAAPEYEGTRAVDEGDTLKSPRSSAPGRKTAPDRTRKGNFRGPGGRIRIYGGAIEPMA